MIKNKEHSKHSLPPSNPYIDIYAAPKGSLRWRCRFPPKKYYDL